MAFLAGAVAAGAWLLWRSLPIQTVAPLPTEWPLTQRNVFNKDERRTYRVLRDALPHHVILSKLPLVRFCQPADPGSVAYWYELLGNSHVNFAICTAQGRVIAAIDLEGTRAPSRRNLQLKQRVLAACQVQYLRCAAGKLPSAAELQLLVPRMANGLRGPQAGPPADERDIDEARDTLAHTVATRRAERSALWQDSSLFQDSFFLIDDVPIPGTGRGPADAVGGAPTDIVGVVVDQPRAPLLRPLASRSA